jgi:Ca-activated chloride channel family protein
VTLLGGLLAAAGAAAAPQPPAVFPSGVEAVFVDAAVLRQGRAVTGLQARHFQLRDNGVVQAVELVAAETLPLDLRIVCDASASLEGPGFEGLRAAARAVVARLRGDDRATLLAFAQDLREHPLRDPAAVDRALASLVPAGRTALRDALYAALVLSSPGRRAVVVALTDGWDNASWVGEDDVAQAALASNATLHLVVGTAPGAREAPEVAALRRIAEQTGGRLWRARDFAGVAPALQAIVEGLRHQYLLRYEPTGVSGPGAHEIDLRLRGAKGQVQARRGYIRPR